MLHFSTRSRLSWVIATMMVVALPGVKSTFAAASPAAVKMLSSELPAGVPASRATLKQTTNAVAAAVSKSPGMAVKITQAALSMKSTKFKMDCGTARLIVEAAISAAPGQAREISEAATAMMPDCAGEFTSLLGSGTPDGGLGDIGTGPTDAAAGFGVGLGGAFPGSPGFIGSAPSGAFAFPPVTLVPVTSTTNR